MSLIVWFVVSAIWVRSDLSFKLLSACIVQLVASPTPSTSVSNCEKYVYVEFSVCLLNLVSNCASDVQQANYVTYGQYVCG